MAFNTPAFGIFLVLVAAASWAAWRLPRVRLGLLLSASAWFYGCFDRRFLVLLAAVVLLDWGAALGIAAARGRARGVVLGLALGAHVGLLGFWKYADFFAGRLLEQPLALLLPVGISFYTFQGASYLLDVHRGATPAERSPLRVALFLSFFPTVVSGPILRAGELFAGLDRPALDADRFGRGLWLVLRGLAKKALLGDWLAVTLVDRVFDLPQQFGSLEVLLGVYGYALQIYGDFSGYTDMARGAGLWLGFEVPENFDRPYASDGIRDFWRRWHMTLGRFIRDYVFFPLTLSAGKRIWLRHLHLVWVMAVVGLWHGAALTFVAWGLAHGLLLALEHVLERRGLWRRIPRSVRVLVTLHLVIALWVPFRADTFAGALDVFAQLFALVPGTENLSWPLVALVAAGMVWQLVPAGAGERIAVVFVRAPAMLQAVTTAVVLHGAAFVMGSRAAPFIYGGF
jgi:D-alanyl-lipoteichoic acid acyltransferase DltB (MBOAT superfamily)